MGLEPSEAGGADHLPVGAPTVEVVAAPPREDLSPPREARLGMGVAPCGPHAQDQRQGEAVVADG